MGEGHSVPGINYERLYAYRLRNVDQGARQAVWAEIAGHLYETLGRPRRVLDAAAGRCEFVNAVPAAERWVVDAAPDIRQHCAPEVQVVVGDVLQVDLPAAHFDGVFVSNFLEHLRSQVEVAGFLVKMHAAIAPGGRIAVLGPNFKYCARSYFDMADHTIALSHPAVEEHLYAAGFRILEVHPRFLPFSFKGVLPASPRLTRWYLRARPLWPLVGRQFLVLAAR